MIHFLFSADGMRPREVDREFAAQAEALRAAGFSVSVVPDDTLTNDRPLTKLPPSSSVVYRGWMLSSEQYNTLFARIQKDGAKPFTTPTQYLQTHHLPGWYPQLADFTPHTEVFGPDVDLVSELVRLGWEQYFIKDYVKSLKTTRGSIIDDPSEAEEIADLMRTYRGEIEGGFCVRRVEAFKPETEQRFFVLNGKPASSHQTNVPDIVKRVAERIDSPFYSVDIVEREDGELRVVEIGDGQVSDLVGWTPQSFAELWSLAYK